RAASRGACQSGVRRSSPSNPSPRPTNNRGARSAQLDPLSTSPTGDSVMTWNSIITSLAGGALIGIGVSVLLLFNGRVAGVVGIVSGLLRPSPNEWGWKAAFVLGLLAGGTAFSI